MAEKPDLKMNVNVNTYVVREFFVNFLVPLVSLAAVAFLFFVVLYPSYKAIPDLRTEASRKETLDNQLKTKLATLERLLDYRSVVEENSELVKNVLEDEAKVPQLLTQIDMIARESGLEVTKLSYSFGESPIARIDTGGGQEVVAGSKVDLVFVSMGVTGNYEQLQTFLTNLENSARLVDTDTFRFALTEEGSNVLTISLTLKSPYLFIQSEAVTDDALRLDITDPAFLAMIDKVKELRFYHITLDSIDFELPQPVEEEPEEEEEIADVVEEEPSPEPESVF
jgi:Tfp pilus assembly protein PilO